MMTAKEANEKSIQRQEELDKEKTIRCQGHFQKLIDQKIPDAVRKGDLELCIDRYDISDHQISLLRDAGYGIQTSSDRCWIDWSLEPPKKSTPSTPAKSDDSSSSQMRPGNPLYDSLYF